jgi:D-alanyl-D-alanine carboxypeptidase
VSAEQDGGPEAPRVTDLPEEGPGTTDLAASADATVSRPDEPASPPEHASPSTPPSPPKPPSRARLRWEAWKTRLPRPEIAIALAGGALLFGAVNALLLGLSSQEKAAATPETSAPAPPPARTQAAVAPALDAGPPSTSASADAGAPAPAASEDPEPEETPPSEPAPREREKPTKDAKPHTVQWAAERACSTAHVDGLSRQIIEESRCLDASAFSRVPHRKNLSSDGHVFLYLDAPARDHLLKALDAHPKLTLKVHSALRTVAQQYLLSRWGAGKRCGVQLANRPGESNHETGLALDVGEPGNWRAALESEGFHWLGSIDRVHFDYVGPGATHHDGLDVRAFQRLWNRNHPDDAIAETGHYDGATQQRLKRSPAAGFPTGARCGGGSEHRVASGRGH